MPDASGEIVLKRVGLLLHEQKAVQLIARKKIKVLIYNVKAKKRKLSLPLF